MEGEDAENYTHGRIFPQPPISVNQKKFSILHSRIQNRSANNKTQAPNSTLKSHHTIIHGDSREMNLLADRSVHLVVTSPPYWQLKDYGTENQIGFHESYESYINNLNFVWNECERVLHPGCRLCINIGDQFARSVSQSMSPLVFFILESEDPGGISPIARPSSLSINPASGS